RYAQATVAACEYHKHDLEDSASQMCAGTCAETNLNSIHLLRRCCRAAMCSARNSGHFGMRYASTSLRVFGLAPPSQWKKRDWKCFELRSAVPCGPSVQ